MPASNGCSFDVVFMGKNTTLMLENFFAKLGHEKTHYQSTIEFFCQFSVVICSMLQEELSLFHYSSKLWRSNNMEHHVAF